MALARQSIARQARLPVCWRRGAWREYNKNTGSAFGNPCYARRLWCRAGEPQTNRNLIAVACAQVLAGHMRLK